MHFNFNSLLSFFLPFLLGGAFGHITGRAAEKLNKTENALDQVTKFAPIVSSTLSVVQSALGGHSAKLDNILTHAKKAADGVTEVVNKVEGVANQLKDTK